MENYCRKALAAFVLVLALTCPVFANDGIAHTDFAPPTNGELQAEPTDGVIYTGLSATDPLASLALNLVLSALSVF